MINYKTKVFPSFFNFVQVTVMVKNDLDLLCNNKSIFVQNEVLLSQFPSLSVMAVYMVHTQEVLLPCPPIPHPTVRSVYIYGMKGLRVYHIYRLLFSGRIK